MIKTLLPLLLVSVSSVLAQGDFGLISGEITDVASGKPVPFANVVILTTQLGGTTDELGHYSIRNIPPGSYQLKASAVGYSTLIKTDVTVNNSKPTQIDFSLKEDILKLANVVITADYFSKDNFESTSITSFSNEEIRRAPGGFEDVVRALSVLPGVAQADAGRNDLVVRGGAPSENLYLLDGYEIPNINHFGTQGATGGPLSFINLDFVKDATFSTGGFSVLYGDKLSSALRINLRNGRSDRIGGKATISASQFGLNIEGPISHNATFFFSARRSYLDFIFKAAGFGFVPEYYDFLLKFDYEPDQKNSFSFFAISAVDNVKYFNTTADQRYKNSNILGSNQIQYSTGLSFRHLMPNGYLKFYLSRNSTDYDTGQRDSLLNPVFLNKSLETEDKFKVEFIHRFSAAFEATTGGDATLTHFNSDILLPFFKTTFGELLPISALNYKNTFFKYAFYLNAVGRLNALLQVGGGLRIDYFDAITDKFSISPRANATVTLTPLLLVNITAGYYRQAPSYIWMAAGNFNLKPVMVKQIVIGPEYRIRNDALVKIEVYQKDYSNYPSSVLRPYLTLANTGAGFQSGAEDNFSTFGLEPLISGGTGRSRGFEFSAQKKLSEIPCYGLLSVTLSQTNFTALDGVERNGAYDQRWIVNLSGGYQFDKFWEAGMKFRYATGRPYTPYNADGSQSVATYNSLRLPDLHSLDLRVDKRWFYEHYTLITYIDLQNIYNHRNVGGVRWNKRDKKSEESNSIGLLPTIGVSLEF